MFLTRRPSQETIDRFIRESHDLPLSYAPELFEVFIDPKTEAVMYRIRAISWPQATLARVGQPIVRALQARFRRQSAATIGRATNADGCGV